MSYHRKKEEGRKKNKNQRMTPIFAIEVLKISSTVQGMPGQEFNSNMASETPAFQSPFVKASIRPFLLHSRAAHTP